MAKAKEEITTTPSSEVISSEVNSAKPVSKVMSLEDYLVENKKHPGLVASFKYEAGVTPSLLEPKSKEDWDKAFEAQSNRKY